MFKVYKNGKVVVVGPYSSYIHAGKSGFHSGQIKLLRRAKIDLALKDIKFRLRCVRKALKELDNPEVRAQFPKEAKKDHAMLTKLLPQLETVVRILEQRD